MFKSAFYYDEWIDAPLESENQNNGAPLNSFFPNNVHNLKNYVVEDNPEPIINNGKLLYNIYSYDYSKAVSVLGQRAMIMLIRREIDNVFNYYIIRVINLLAHEQSSVYKDFYVSEVNECIGLNIENEDAVQSIITFSLLCDSSIYRYEARLTEKITINTEHSYWNDHKNYLIANVTQ